MDENITHFKKTIHPDKIGDYVLNYLNNQKNHVCIFKHDFLILL